MAVSQALVPAPERLSDSIIGQLRRYGSDTSQSHQFCFFLYFPNCESALAAARQLRYYGYRSDVVPFSSGDEWLCQTHLHIIPNLAFLELVERQLGMVATNNHGVVDGWEANYIEADPILPPLPGPRLLTA